jgi:hypothetical protein
MRDALRRVLATLIAFTFLGGILGHATLLPCRMIGGMQTMALDAGNDQQTKHEQAPSSKDHDIACSLFCASAFAFTTPHLPLDITLKGAPILFSPLLRTLVGHSVILDPGIPKRIA